MSPAMAQQYASPALSDWTSANSSPLLSQTEKPRYYRQSYTPVATNSNKFTGEQPKSLIEEQHQHLKTLQHYDNLIGYVVTMLSVTLTGGMDGIMVYVLYTFYKTRGIPGGERKSPWAKDTQLWPAFTLLIASFLTLCIDLAALIAACFSHFTRKRDRQLDSKTRAMRVESRFNKLGYAVFGIKWITVFILYRIGKTGKDLWGWSCVARFKNIQQFYVLYLNFDELCTVQTTAFYLSLSEMAIKILLAITVFWLGHKVKELKRDAKM